jgi:hypothetical protein
MTNHEIAKDYLSRIDSLTYNELADAMTYKWFRLNTLYHIKDKSGKKVLFTPNAEQEDFYLTQHGLDIILKARQLGFTTFKMISDLDNCLFTENFSAGCICHNLEDAKDIFRNKIKYAYQNITDDQRELLAEIGYQLPVPLNDKDNSYVFDNGSSIKVSVSYRGGTLQSLHVSEFGKICKKYPEKAKEIVTGAFEAVAVGNEITIESTAEGKEGYFFNYCNEAKKILDSGRKPSVLEFAFHFYPWWTRGEYSISGRIANGLLEYFIELEKKHGITLTDNQKAWYSAKWRTLGDDMKREYPSTPDEAFAQSVEGAYYAKQFAQIYADKRIGAMPKNDAPVHTAWDLGVGDSTAIWFYQLIGNKIHLIDFYENSGEGMRHYFKVLKDKASANGWKYGDHFAPHDMNHAEFGSDAKSRRQIAAEGFIIDGTTYSINFKVLKLMGIDEGIELVRELLPRCCFDESKCEEGITRLEQYRKEWNDKLGCWRDKPLHDWTSHCADAFRYLAMAVTKNQPIGNINVSFYGR